VSDNSALAVLVLDTGRTAELLIAGDLDLSADAVLDPAVSDLLIDPYIERIDVDAALVGFCDSSGLTALVRAHRRSANYGVPLRLVQAGPRLHHILDITGLWQTLTTIPE
jgi:anti-anti-sigma factor